MPDNLNIGKVLPTEEATPATPVQAPTETTTEMTEAEKSRALVFESQHFNVGKDIDTASHLDAPSFAQSTWWNIQDDGFTANAARMFSDLNNDPVTDQDREQLDQAMPALLQRLPNNGQGLEDMVLDAGSVEQANEVIDRYNRVTTHQRYQQNEGIVQGLGAGVAGFVLDPSNFLLTLKGAQVATQVAAKIVPTVGKTYGTMLAAGGVAGLEEAVRNVPRLANDPTYGQEQYLTTVVASVAFGGGLMAAFPTARFVYGKAQPQMDRVGKAVSDSLHQYKLDVSARTVANTMTEVAYQGSKVITKKDVAHLDIKAAARTARTRAQATVDAKLREVDVEGIKAKINTIAEKGTYEEVISEVNDSVSSIVEALRTRIPEADLPDFDKAASSIVAKVADIKLGGKPDSAGSMRRQETVGTKVGDAVHDVQTAYNDLRKLADKVDKFSDAIPKAAKDSVDTATASIDSAYSKMYGILETAHSALDDVAARQGKKINRKVIKADEVTARSKVRIKKELNGDRSAEVNTRIKEAGLKMNMTREASLSAIKGLHIPTDPKTNMMDSIVDWINTPPTMEARGARISAVQRITKLTMLNQRAHIDVASNVTGRQKQELENSINKLIDDVDSAYDWMGIVNAFPYEDMARMSPKWQNLAAGFEQGMGADLATVQKQYDSAGQMMISNSLGKLTESLSSKLVRSKLSLPTWYAMNVLELPTGTGGIVTRADSAALVSRQMEDRLNYPLNKAWHAMMDAAGREAGMDGMMGGFQRRLLKDATPNTDEAARGIAQRVQLEMNARQMGKASDQPNYVKEFANALQKYNDDLFDLQLEHGVDGIKADRKMKNYMKQKWKDGTLLDHLADPEVGEAGMVQLFKSAVMNRNKTLTSEAAEAYAEAIIANKKNVLSQPRKESYHIGRDTIENSADKLEDVLHTLKQRLGEGESADRMLNEITDIMGALDNGGPGYTNARQIHIDLDTSINYNGRKLSMVDLMDSNVLSHALEYGREATGRSAIAKSTGGLIKSDADMDSFLRAAGLQALEQGTHINTGDMRNAYRSMVGQPLDGALPMDARRIRDAVALAGMNGLGESQLAEMGLALNRGMAGLVASGQFISKTKGAVRKKFTGFELTPEQLNNKQFLDDMQEMSGLYEDMHIFANNDTHFDVRQANAQVGTISKAVHTATGGKYQPYLKYLQGRHTGYGAIRTMEEQIAMGGVVQDLARHIVGNRKSFTSDGRFKDVGLMKSNGDSILKKYIDDGTVLLDGDHITNLNVKNWSLEDRNSFGVALRRHAGQQVQMGYAGELSPLMQRPDVAFLMQFKTYPLMAAEKQQGRNIKFADKEAAMGMTLNAASSGIARAIRYASLSHALPEQDREAYYNKKLENLGQDTFMYMGSAGAIFPLGEIVGAAGIDNPFSDSRDDFTGMIPAVNWAENYVKAARSAGNVATGQGTDRDLYNMQAGAPLGTVMQMNMIAGAVRDLMAEDAPSKGEPFDVKAAALKASQ